MAHRCNKLLEGGYEIRCELETGHVGDHRFGVFAWQEPQQADPYRMAGRGPGARLGADPKTLTCQEKYRRLWVDRRAEIQTKYDPVGYRRRGLGGLAQETQRLQDVMMQAMAEDMEWVWQGDLGKLWQWSQRVDLGLLAKQLEVLAWAEIHKIELYAKLANGELMGVTDALEGVMNMLGELRDLLEKGAKDGQCGTC